MQRHPVEGFLDFSQCMTEYGAAFRRLAASYEGDPALQEDLYQEICLGVWRALPRFRGASSLRTYLYRIAHNQALRHLTRRRREPLRPDDQEATLASLADAASTPERSAVEGDARRRLARQIRALPLSLRQPLVLKLEGLTDREIGETLDLRTGTVSVRLTRARRALGAALQPRAAGERGRVADDAKSLRRSRSR